MWLTRCGQAHELRYHPGETNLRMADVVVINKVDSAKPAAVAAVAANVAAVNPAATIIRAASPVVLEPGPSVAGARVLVVEDGPTLTHGGMPYGAGTVAARQAGAASFVDPGHTRSARSPRPSAPYPSIGHGPAGHGLQPAPDRRLRATIDAADCDVVVTGTPIGLRRVVGTTRPIRQARYELRELGHPDLADILAPSWPRPGPAGRSRPSVERREDDMRTLHPQTRENLLRAMRREAYAFAMYLLYATQARKHGRPEIGQLFEQVAKEEYFGHFVEQALELGQIGMEAENLHLAIEEEAFEAEVMYRDFQAQAEAVGDHAPPSGSGASARTSGATATSSWPSCGPWTRPTRPSRRRPDRATATDGPP